MINLKELLAFTAIVVVLSAIAWGGYYADKTFMRKDECAAWSQDG
jgi:hypothetical protein